MDKNKKIIKPNEKINIACSYHRVVFCLSRIQYE